jgi:hypothetical protein
MRAHWAGRARTLEAIVRIALARAMIAVLPFGWWKHRLGEQAALPRESGADPAASPPLHIAHVRHALDRACHHLPGETRCLHRAMAMQAMLRVRNETSLLVLGIGPQNTPGPREFHARLICKGFVVTGEDSELGHPILAFQSVVTGN